MESTGSHSPGCLVPRTPHLDREEEWDFPLWPCPCTKARAKRGRSHLATRCPPWARSTRHLAWGGHLCTGPPATTAPSAPGPLGRGRPALGPPLCLEDAGLGQTNAEREWISGGT